MREFSTWTGKQIEKVCDRNDNPRPGKPIKPPWERQTPGDLYRKIEEEWIEVVEAYHDYMETPDELNRAALQWELADVAATCMMLSARVDPIMSGLRRGRVRGRDFLGEVLT